MDMSDFFLKNTFPSRRTRLSREELLAGKCFPEDEANSSADPRLRSPDEILTQKAPRPMVVEHQPQRFPPDENHAEIMRLQRQYESEIEKWRDYEEHVTAWKIEANAVLGRYKNAFKDVALLTEQLEKAQAQLKKQEQELMWLRQQMISSSIKNGAPDFR
jgi:hypothetical protein